MRLGGFEPGGQVTLDPFNRDSLIGDVPVESKTTTHFHDRTPFALCIRIRKHFNGTRMSLVPSGTRGILRLQDPYGRQIPHYRVIVTKGTKPKTYTYWFQEFRWVPKKEG